MNIVGIIEDSCACVMEKLQFGSKLSAGWSCCLPGWLCSEEVLTDLLPDLHHCWVESGVSFRDNTQRPQNVCDVCSSLNFILFYVSSFILFSSLILLFSSHLSCFCRCSLSSSFSPFPVFFFFFHALILLSSPEISACHSSFLCLALSSFVPLAPV